MSKRHLQPASAQAVPGARTGGGFTLIELLVVAAIAAILAAIAYPSYQAQVQKTRRADAQAVLMQGAQFMERIYTESGSYSPAAATGAFPFAKSPIDGTETYYTIELSVPDSASFTITATPDATKASKGKLYIDQTGLRRWDANGNTTIEDSEKHW